MAKARRKSSKEGFEKKGWYLRAVAILGLIGALIGVVKPIRETFFPPFNPVQNNSEIVIDRSQGMAADFDGVSKFNAAGQAVRSFLAASASSDNLALREFGGCGGKNTKLVVKFGQKNHQKIESALGKVTLSGAEGELANAVIEATGDFNDHARFDKVNKQLQRCLRGRRIFSNHSRSDRTRSRGS